MANLERVTTATLAPVYIIGSDQPLLVSRAVDAIIDAAVPPAMRAFNLDIIETRDATAARIIAMCQTLPMMAEKRAVLVRDIGPMNAAELGKLMPYIESPNPSTVLVAVSSKVDKRLGFYKKIAKTVLHVLEAPAKIGPWIREEADARGLAMESSACDRLADVVGKDLARLALSLDQLALFAGEDTVITSDHVDELIADTRERTVFELLNAISRGDRAGALAAVAALTDQQQSSIGVVTMIARHIRSLGMCHVAREKRMSGDATLAPFLGVPRWKVKMVMGEARRYPPMAVGQALARLSAADQELKGMTPTVKILGKQLGERVILDRLVSEIIALGAQGGGSGQRGRQHR